MTEALNLIAINFKTYDLIDRFLDSLRRFPPRCETTLTIIDNATDRAKLAALDVSGLPVEVHKIPVAANLGYARACNLGALLGEGRYVALLNSDTRFTNPDCLDRMVEFMDAKPECAVAGPLQVDDAGMVTHAGIFGSHAAPQMRAFHHPMRPEYRLDSRCITVSGSAYFVRRTVWDEMTACPIFMACSPYAMGAFLHTEHYFEESWLSWHVHGHGYEVWYVGSAEMEHLWHKSSPEDDPRDVGLFQRSRETFRFACTKHDLLHD